MKALLRFILPFPLILIFGVVICLVAFVELVVASAIDDGRIETANVSCSYKSLEAASESRLRMNVECAGKEHGTKNADFILAYLKQPGPFKCNVYKDGSVACTMPE